MKWFLRACPACGGDLYEDIEDESLLTCFLCARTFAHDEAMPKIGVKAPSTWNDEALKPAA